MRKSLFITLIFWSLLSCNNKKINYESNLKITSVSSVVEQDTILSNHILKSKIQESTDTIVDGDNKFSPCIFDQETQNDKFLHGIKEFEGYVWNSQTKTATIELSKNLTLEIFRGGCDHFVFSAKFIVPNSYHFEKNKNEIYSKIIWASKLIYSEIDYALIKKHIEKGEVSETTEDNENVFMNFIGVELYELFYMNFEYENNHNSFSIGYFLN